MSNFAYPLLPREEIASILKEANIAYISNDDLKNPNFSFISDLYTRLLIYLDLLTEEDHGQVEFSALEQLENPDNHADSIKPFNLLVRIRELVQLLDCRSNFTLKDLLRPDADRTQYFLSAILNLCLYQTTKMDALHSIVDEVTLLDEQRRESEHKILQVNAEIAEYNDAREKELPLVQEIDAKVKELQQTLTGLNQHQMALSTSLKKLKDSSKAMDGEISKAEFDLVQSAQENANLRSKVVQSPDKLQKALEERKLVRESAQNAVRAAKQQYEEKTTVLEVYSKTSKKMSKHLNQMQAIYDQLNSAKAIEKDYKALKSKLDDDKVTDKLLDAKLVDLQVKVKQVGDQRKEAERERNLKSEEAVKKHNSVMMEVESRRCELEERRRKVEAVVSEGESYAEKANAVRESGAAKVEEIVRKCSEISEQFKKYKKHMEQVLENSGCP